MGFRSKRPGSMAPRKAMLEAQEEKWTAGAKIVRIALLIRSSQMPCCEDCDDLLIFSPISRPPLGARLRLPGSDALWASKGEHRPPLPDGAAHELAGSPPQPPSTASRAACQPNAQQLRPTTLAFCCHRSARRSSATDRVRASPSGVPRDVPRVASATMGCQKIVGGTAASTRLGVRLWFISTRPNHQLAVPHANDGFGRVPGKSPLEEEWRRGWAPLLLPWQRASRLAFVRLPAALAARPPGSPGGAALPLDQRRRRLVALAL